MIEHEIEETLDDCVLYMATYYYGWNKELIFPTTYYKAVPQGEDGFDDRMIEFVCIRAS